MNTKPTIGFIGLGLMGQAMAKNLIDAGYTLHLHSRTKSSAVHLVEKGGHWCETPAQLAQRVGAGIITICVTDSTSLEQVMTGEAGLLNELCVDALIIDMGTSRFELTQTLAQGAKALQANYIDAPVSGGQIGAQQGNLSIMVGANDTQLKRAQALFDVLGNKTTHVGGVGCGQLAKAANQMIVGATLNIVSEALYLAQQNGADPAKVKQALTGGFADSKILQVHGQRMLDRDFTPGAKATTQLKDLQQAHDLAKQSQLNLPLNEACLKQWQAMVDAQLGHLDQAGILAWVEKNN